MSEKGFHGVIEGPDGSGKTLQTEYLQKRLTEEGCRVKVLDFPRYEETKAGELAGRMQTGEFGNPAEISPYISCLPYLIDQAGASGEIERWVQAGGVLISNRYTTSNVHQIGKIEKGEERDKYRKWLWEFAYEEMKIRRPELVVVLFVDLPICRENIEKKAARKYTGGQIADLVERDVGYQREAEGEYRKMVEENPDWWVGIECCSQGSLLSPQEIHEKVYGVVKGRVLV